MLDIHSNNAQKLACGTCPRRPFDMFTASLITFMELSSLLKRLRGHDPHSITNFQCIVSKLSLLNMYSDTRISLYVPALSTAPKFWIANCKKNDEKTRKCSKRVWTSLECPFYQKPVANTFTVLAKEETPTQDSLITLNSRPQPTTWMFLNRSKLWGCRS